MSELAAVTAALTEYANRPATSHDVRAEAGEVFGHPPLVALMRFARSVDSRDELNAVLAEVAPLIRANDPFRGGVIAINCGSLVEMGGAPGLVFPHLFAALPRHLALAHRAREHKAPTPGALFDKDPDAARAAAGLTYLLLATMTVICRKAEFRQTLRATPDVVAGITNLRDTSDEAAFVAQVLVLTDDLELLVLVPEEQKGFRVALEAINNNFHLFTLLQAALISGGHRAGEPPNPEVLGVATGETPQQYARLDHARWHFYAWAGLLPDDTLAATDFTTWIPGDAAPATIPILDGTRIVIVGPMVLDSRSWNSNEFAAIHDALRSRVDVVEVLPPDRVAAWLDRIKRAPR
jgi:hypothetical protein